jgi:hypothetical protein
MIGFVGSTNSPLLYFSISSGFGSSLQRFAIVISLHTLRICIKICITNCESTQPLASKYLACMGVFGSNTNELFISTVRLPLGCGAPNHRRHPEEQEFFQ